MDSTRNRRAETRLAYVSLVGLAVYAPLETVASWQMFGGPWVLLHPGFAQSIAAFGLVLWGALRSLRARPRPSPTLLCIAHAWCASLFWHAANVRFNFMQTGGTLFYGQPEFWIVFGGAGLAVALFASSLRLALRVDRRCTAA